MYCSKARLERWKGFHSINIVVYVFVVFAKLVEEMTDFLDLEESSQLLGGEAKGNAVLAADPIIRQMHALVKGMNLEQVHQAINSEAIRSNNKNIILSYLQKGFIFTKIIIQFTLKVEV
jgi:DNA gyrase/topoisomerase IV subunit A